jgi:hypothetical protein
VPAADHGEALCTVEHAAARDDGDRLLAGVDDLGVFLALEGIGAHAEQPVLAVQQDLHALGHVVGHQGRNTDAQVHDESVLKFPGRSLGHLFAGARHRSLRCSSAGAPLSCAAHVAARLSVRIARVAHRAPPAGRSGGQPPDGAAGRKGTPEILPFERLLEAFRGDEVLVLNDTRVVPARVRGQKATGGAVELFVVDLLGTDAERGEGPRAASARVGSKRCCGASDCPRERRLLLPGAARRSSRPHGEGTFAVDVCLPGVTGDVFAWLDAVGEMPLAALPRATGGRRRTDALPDRLRPRPRRRCRADGRTPLHGGPARRAAGEGGARHHDHPARRARYVPARARGRPGDAT